MNWNDIALELAQVLLPVVAAALIALIGYGVAYLRKQAQKIDNDIAQQAIIGALFEAERVAKDAINATNQTLVDSLKEKATDGKLTKEEMAQAMTEAQQYFVTHVSAGSMDILKATLGPIEDWLKDFLEAKLGEQKGFQAQSQVIRIANPTLPGPAA